jgi:hypothetical protein
MKRIRFYDHVAPGPRCARAGTAKKLADRLMEENPAAASGKEGGKTTAKKMMAKDPDYYKRISAMRKTRCGGGSKKRLNSPLDAKSIK